MGNAGTSAGHNVAVSGQADAPTARPANGVCRTGPLIAPQAAAAIAPFAAEPADLR